MPILRLAYATLFLIALMAVFTLWSQVGGQSHLDLMPWYLKLGLGAGAAFAVVKAIAAAVAGSHSWNAGTLKWFGILLLLLTACGLASYYCHMYLETDEEDQTDNSSVSRLQGPKTPAAKTAGGARTGQARSGSRNLAGLPAAWATHSAAM
ncbi:MAG: hypothetical protein ABSF62_12835 [Bryobacteraceae bacterium]|jgi:hypothetical protein